MYRLRPELKPGLPALREVGLELFLVDGPIGNYFSPAEYYEKIRYSLCFSANRADCGRGYIGLDDDASYADVVRFVER